MKKKKAIWHLKPKSDVRIMIPEYLEAYVMKKQLDIIAIRTYNETGVDTDPIYLWCG